MNQDYLSPETIKKDPQKSENQQNIFTENLSQNNSEQTGQIEKQNSQRERTKSTNLKLLKEQNKRPPSRSKEENKQITVVIQRNPLSTKKLNSTVYQMGQENSCSRKSSHNPNYNNGQNSTNINQNNSNNNNQNNQNNLNLSNHSKFRNTNNNRNNNNNFNYQNQLFVDQQRKLGNLRKDEGGYSNWIYTLIIIVFLIVIFLIFASFISIVIKNTYSIKGPHYEISSSQKSEEGMFIYATCKKCDQFYGNPDNLIAQNLNLTIKYITNDSFQFFMSGMNFTKEFELPYYEPFWTSKQQQIVSEYSQKFTNDDSSNFFSGNLFQSDDNVSQFNKKNYRNYLISIRDNPLELIVTRKETQSVIFYFSSVDLIYSEQYKFINVTTNTEQVFGLGERTGGFQLKNGNYTLWNQQYDPERLEKEKFEPNMNGYHPVYLSKEKQFKYNIAYLRTSSALEIQKKDKNLCYKILGGNVNFVIFLGNGKPSQVIKDFHRFIGNYIIPPYWAFGIHHKFDNFQSIQDLQYLSNNFTSNNIPLDVLWFDQSYLYNGQAFNYDHQKFPSVNITEMFPNVNFIPSMQPGVKIADSMAYIEGVRRNVFITDDQKTVYSGKSHQGDSVLYPDFFSTQIYDFWSEMFGILYNDFKFSGIYFYDNEVTDFTNYKKFTQSQKLIQFNKQIQKQQYSQQKSNFQAKKLIPKTNQQDNKKQNILNSNYIEHHDFYDQYNEYETQNQQDKSQYFYKFLQNQEKLEINSIPLNSTHSNGFKEFNTHNLFNLQQSYLTHNYLKQWAKLPLNFIISKSTFPGMGRFGGHLVDDQGCSWDALKDSVSQLFAFNLYGIPLVGFQDCFNYDNEQDQSNQLQEDSQLILRKLQLSVIYPFFVTKSSAKTAPFFSNPMIKQQIIQSQQIRYTLSKYVYTNYFLNKGSQYKPLFLVYDEDINIFDNPKFIQEQILIGENIMACPILAPDTIAIEPYFPQENWFDFYSGIQIKNKQDLGGKIRIQNDIQSKIPLYVKGGTIIPLQSQINRQKTQNTSENQQNIENSENNENEQNSENEQNEQNNENEQNSENEQNEQNQNLKQLEKSHTLLTSFVLKNNGNLYSKGEILGLQDFSEQNVYDKCVRQNCLVEVEARAVTVVERFPLQSYYYITFSFRGAVGGVPGEDLLIDSFVFFGLSENKMVQKRSVVVKNGVGDFSLTVTL